MSSFSLLNLGTQALRSNQTALSTVGQNISNVNTPGYSRQVANFETLPDRSGVKIDDIDRITNKFLTQQLWSDLSTYNQSSTFTELASQLDDLLATEVTSVSNALDNYFGALQNVVDDPVSMPNRELFIAEADAVVKRFNDLDANIRRQSDTINEVVSDLASQVTTLATNIADLNNKIRVAVASNNPANELRDQREELTNQLSELVGIKVIEQDLDEFSIFVGNGQPLVVGISANPMIATPGDPDRSVTELSLVVAGNQVNVNDQLSGGRIGGLLQYRNETLNDARDELGRIAIGFAESMNTQHRSGMDLNNQLGSDLYGDINAPYLQYSRIMAQSDNQSDISTARVEITDISKLKATDYELVYDGENQITLVRNSDGKQLKVHELSQVTAPTVVQGIAAVGDGEYYLDPGSSTLSFSVDGMKVTIDTQVTLARGDRFMIQPVRNGAEDLNLVVNDGRKLALASPVRVTAGTENLGSGVAKAVVTDPDAASFDQPLTLSPPIDIRFNAPDASTPNSVMTYTIYDMSNPSNPVVLDLGAGPLAAIDYTAGETIQLDGYDVVIGNQPQPGDRFSFTFNKDGFSDNRNALTLSDLQQTDLFDSGAYQDLYGSLVERVGTRTATARISVDANKAVLDSTVTAKSSVSGVNLDEEAAKLVQFQQAYQASAQLISTSQTLFDTLLNSI